MQTFYRTHILFCFLKSTREALNAALLVARMKGDTPVNSTMSVGQARKLVEQLKIEASFCRIKVRQSEHLRVR